MRRLIVTVLGLMVLVLSATTAHAGKPRKLPVSAYIKSAKIEILSGDMERYETAIAMLDSLFMHYGPHAEGLYLMGQIMVDKIEKTATPAEKEPLVATMVAYIDSLHMCCSNKEIKKKYRDDCDEYTAIADSIKIKYWRQFFNDGLRQFQFAEELKGDLADIQDSASRAGVQQNINMNLDSCIENMSLAVTTIPDSTRPYLIVDKAYGIRDEYEKGIEWLERGYEVAEDKGTIQMSLAYDYIQMHDFCSAIPYYRDFLVDHPDNVDIMTNLAICFNNCQMYDSAVAIYFEILKVDSQNVDVLTGVGRFFNTQAREAADSANAYQAADNTERAGYWTERKEAAFDSARVYYRRAFELNPDDPDIAEQYGLVCFLLEDYEEATVGFAKAAELRPSSPQNWTTLGDLYISLKEFQKATEAYEKVVELTPDNVRVWEHLVDLYKQNDQPDKLAEARKKLDELNQ